MTESKFTQGPWTIFPEEVDKPYIRIRGTQLGGRFKIANVVTPVYEGVHEREAQETRANARLIAKAPEMYGMLSKILQESYCDFQRLGDIERLIKEIDA